MNRALESEFDALSRSLPARVGVAIAGVRAETIRLGDWTSGVAWSTVKVPLAVAASRAECASPDQLRAVIMRSDNATAEELWSQLGDSAAGRVQSVIREAGDVTTLVESRRLRAEFTPFGQTQWSLVEQAQFAAGLPQVPGASPIIELMADLCVDHRWGLAAKGFAAKGGWGPGLGGEYLVRQFAVVPGFVGVALAAEAGDEGSGVAVVDALADWVVEVALAEH